MKMSFFQDLYDKGEISAASMDKISAAENNKLISVHAELKLILYLGVLLLTGGVGILVYKNIDTIGHQAILAFLAAVSAGSFYYCIKKVAAWSPFKVSSPNVFFDYVLLAGCLTLLIFLGYLQFQYAVFGIRYGLATFIPLIILFVVAYRFDHLGVLCLAITNLAAWAGIAITPARILHDNDFSSDRLILTGILLSLLLLTAGRASVRKNIKAHFAFTYDNFGANMLFISVLAALFNYGNFYGWILLGLIMTGYLFYRKSKRERSFYYLLVTMIYLYTGFGYAVVSFLFDGIDAGVGGIYLAFLYFILSAVGCIIFLVRNIKSKPHDRL